MTDFNLTLWNQLEKLKSDYKWVDLSRKVSPNTPHWSGFEAMKVEPLYELDKDGFTANTYTVVSQYGTHIDAPIHFVKDRRTLDEITLHELCLPLCVIDKSDEVSKNDDFILEVEHILEWEQKYGKIPEGSFVAFRSDWSKRPDDSLDNVGEDSVKHFPGWSVPALEFLVKERNVTAVGHETSDTDPGIISAEKGLVAETYILSENRYQVELLQNLHELPPKGAIIFVGFPNIEDGVGFTARCVAVCPK